jgi:superfamily II DNA or RNA helicase
VDIELRPYQLAAVEALRTGIRAGKANQMLAAATGSGKTLMAAHLIDEARKRGKRSLFVVDRTVLIDQTSAVFDQYGIPHGIIQADHWRRRSWELVQIASAQTLARRCWPEDPALIVVDEAHVIHKNVAKRINVRDTITIGLSATPFAKGLGTLYDDVVTVIPTHTLIRDGFLAPYRIFAPSEPDMEGAKVNWKGEWDDDEAERRSMPIIGDVVAEYLSKGNNGRFIAVGVNVNHCAEMQRQFMAAGVQSALFTYRTPDEERRQIADEFRKSDSYIRGLVSVAALSRGFDVPGVEVIIMARPLRKALAEHIQVLGRGLRIDPDNPSKTCLILDHSGNTIRFFERTESFFAEGLDALDDSKHAERKKAEQKEREPVKCPKCAAVHSPRPACPACGHEYPQRNTVSHRPGELQEIGGGTSSREDRQALYSQLLYIADRRGWKAGAAAWRYKERTGMWPRGLSEDRQPATPELERWVKSRVIAWAKKSA